MFSNELIFFCHVLLLSFASLAALRLGKEALIAFICLQSVLANLFVIKQMTFFGLNATTADAFAIGSVLSLNFLQEYFGKESAQRAIWINLFVMIMYVMTSQIQLAYIPNMHDHNHTHYVSLLSSMPHIVAASIFVFFIAQQFDYFLYGFIKKVFKNKYLVLRNCLSIGICQLFDTVLFTMLALWGIADNLLEIIIISYTIKLLAIAASTPAIALTRMLVKSRSV